MPQGRLNSSLVYTSNGLGASRKIFCLKPLLLLPPSGEIWLKAPSAATTVTSSFRIVTYELCPGICKGDRLVIVSNHDAMPWALQQQNAFQGGSVNMRMWGAQWAAVPINPSSHGDAPPGWRAATPSHAMLCCAVWIARCGMEGNLLGQRAEGFSWQLSAEL